MNYWAWGGKYIGYRSGDYLYSRNGNPMGKFYGEELYNFSGDYIGEIRSNDRLIIRSSKKDKRKSTITRPSGRSGRSYCDYIGYVMMVGYEDFYVNE